MYCLFVYEYVPNKADWETFLAPCATEEVALGVAKQFACNEINKFLYPKTPKKKLKEKLENSILDIEEATTLEQLNEVFLKLELFNGGPFSIRQIELISDRTEYMFPTT